MTAARRPVRPIPTPRNALIARIVHGVRLDEDARALRELVPTRNLERWLLLAALLFLLVLGGIAMIRTISERDAANQKLLAAEKKLAELAIKLRRRGRLCVALGAPTHRLSNRNRPQ